MTISNTTRSVRIQGNGATTVFDFEFLIPTGTLTVILYDTADGSYTELDPSEYSATGLDDEDGGSVTYPLNGDPIPSTQYLIVRRDVPNTQALDIANQGGFFADQVMEQLDLMVMADQQLAEVQSRSLITVEGDTFSRPMPLKTELAGNVLAFDDDGEPTTGPSVGEVSSAGGYAQQAIAAAAAASTSETNAANSATAAAQSAASIDPDTLLRKAENLSGLASADTALENLGAGAEGITVLKTSTLAALKEHLSLSTADVSWTAPGEGAVQTTLQARLAGFIVAKDYGVVADGATDDTVAIQRAIDAALASTTRGATVYWPAGVMKTTDQICLYPQVSMIGQSARSTVFQCNPTDALTVPAFIIGDAAYRANGGEPTVKGWTVQNIRFEATGTKANGHGVYIIGVAGAIWYNVEITGFKSLGKYGLILTGNTDPGDGAGVDLGEGNVYMEGHYNTFIGCYIFGNTHGVYIGGDYFNDVTEMANGQCNNNTFIGGAIRQNDNRNLTLSATNSNHFAGVSLEALSTTSFGIYAGYTRCQDNTFYKCRFEGPYTTAPWRFVDDANIKRNFVDLPTYSSNYATVDPTSASFIGDPGGRNYLRHLDLNGNLICYGPSQKFVAPGSTNALDIGNLIKTYTATTAHSATGANVGTSITDGRTDTSTTATTAAAHARFYNPNGQVGSISTSGSATAFSTSSDQRLKEDERDFDAGKIVDELKVYDFAWKVDGTRSHGVFAQEAIEVYPQAVVEGFGEMPWSVDYSKFVPLLIREVQALRARVAELEG